MAVAQLFISWDWNVGHDRIDIGHDLYVAPSHDIYTGGRFLVQVKGTAKISKASSIRASVSKRRLRQYAESSIPVFIIRATPDKKLYWLHAQEWAKNNKLKLLGNGNSSLDFDYSKSLDDRRGFESYLKPILSAIKLNSREQILTPTSINSRSGFNIKTKNNKNSILPENILANLSFIPVNKKENLENFKDALFFGLPRRIAVENFKLKGLPLPENYSGKFGKGEITICPTESTPGKIRIVPGKNRTITSTELSLDVESFSGFKGFATSNERKDNLLDICVHFTTEDSLNFLPSAKLSFRTHAISQHPIKNADQLSQIHLWAEQALSRRGFALELDFFNERISLPLPKEHQKEALDFLHLAHTLGKIHLIARTTGSNFTIPAEFSIPLIELNDINIAFSILRGEKQLANSLLSLRLEPSKGIPVTKKINMFGRKTIAFQLLGQELCRVPVRFDLINCQTEHIPNSTDMLITPGNDGKAWLSFADDYTAELEGAWFSSK